MCIVLVMCIVLARQAGRQLHQHMRVMVHHVFTLTS
jgi:hypothetical protein